MTVEILMPALSPTMSEGKLSKWLVKEGDKIKAGDLLAEIETDKAIMEFESAEDGIILELLIKEGIDNVKVNEPIALINTSTSEDDLKTNELNQNIKEDKKQESNNSKSLFSNEHQEEQLNLKNSNNKNFNSKRIRISPLAKKIASQNKVDIKNLKGTGPAGRIVKIDVLNYIDSSKNISTFENLNSEKTDEEDILILNPMRKTIAERLSESKREIPHFYLRKKVFIDELLSARKILNKKLEHANIKISLNDIIIKAVAHALYNNPKCNVTWGHDKIIRSKKTDIAVAVAVQDGLLTPVVKNVKSKTLSDLSQETKALIERTRNKRLKPDELVGGTITISNLGMMGIDNFDAIINPPQGSILAVGKTEEIPAFDKNNDLTKKTVLHLTMSIDHRMIDGAIGANFFNEIASYLEEPIKLLA